MMKDSVTPMKEEDLSSVSVIDPPLVSDEAVGVIE
jgi:hypothetical protein